MVTKKATTKKSVTTKSVNETKVVCPVCGTEFDVLAQHEHKENVTVLGMDSGLGTVVLPVSKRGEALEAAGIDTSKYFSINVPGGEPMMMKKTDDGRAVPVSADDPIVKAIMGGGTVPNKRLFRRWVMSQVFHGLRTRGGFSRWLYLRGYKYMWEQVIEELHVQSKLYGKDPENFAARNRWFHKALCEAMAEDYIRQLRKDANGRPQHKCKGVPYVTVEHQHYFVSDIEKKLVSPMYACLREIRSARTPQELEAAVRLFWRNAPVKQWGYKQFAGWKDAYKGAGAYFTMQNLLRFHGASFPKDNGFYTPGGAGLQMLDQAAHAYAGGDGWRLFGLMKQMLDENGIDIEKKMQQWADAKKARRA
jgi:hypothetical protein